jgi:hypothetical protein
MFVVKPSRQKGVVNVVHKQMLKKDPKKGIQRYLSAGAMC